MKDETRIRCLSSKKYISKATQVGIKFPCFYKDSSIRNAYHSGSVVSTEIKIFSDVNGAESKATYLFLFSRNIQDLPPKPGEGDLVVFLLAP